MEPLLSVILPVSETGEALGCLESLERHPPDVPFELILAGSGPEADELAGLLEGEVTVVHGPEGSTTEGLLDAGATGARGDLLLFLDDAVRVQPGWFAPLAACFDADPSLAAVMPRISSDDGRLAHAGGLALAGDELLVYGAGADHPDAPQFSCRRSPDFVSTACLLLRRQALRAAGGMAPGSTPRTRADADLSFRLRASGGQLLYEPQSQVVMTGTAPPEVPAADRARAERWAHRPRGTVPGEGRSILFVYSSVPADGGFPGFSRLAGDGHHVACYLFDGGAKRQWATRLSEFGIPCYGVDPATAPRGHARMPWQRAHGASLPAVLVRFGYDTVVFADADAACRGLAYVRTFAPEATVVADTTGWSLGDHRHSELMWLGQTDRVLCAPGAVAELTRFLPGTEVVGRPDPASPEAGDALRSALGPAAPVEVSVPTFDPDRGCTPGLVSVVIPVWNRLELTRPCIESLRRYSGRPYEIIVVDNGSSDGTAAWLARQPDLTVITNTENRGFAAACNQGMAAARGEYVVVLNNDTRVPRRWLDGVLGAFSAPDVGAVGPRSNSVSGPQVVPGARYRTASEFVRFAEEWRRAHRGQTQESTRLVGFCLALRRAALDAVGGFDEAFGPGNFEDDDLCLRLRAAGWRLLVADEVLVHHEGHASFGEGLYGAMGRGLRHFQRKYGATSTEAAEPLLSACLIVKDEEDVLPDCLLSLRQLADEVVVVDTGSTDSTPELARAAGCRVVEVAWNDDFAEARNASLDAARGEWALIIDADERAGCVDPAGLRDLLPALQTDVVQVLIRSQLAAGDGSAFSEHRLERLFRRSRFRYQGRLHEQLRRIAGTPVDRGFVQSLWLEHDGYRPEVVAAREKMARNERIARADYETGTGERWHRALNLARSSGDPGDQVRYYGEALEHMPAVHVRHRVQSLCGLAAAQLDLGQAEAAATSAELAVALDPGHGEALYRLGAALNRLERHEAATGILRQAIEAPVAADTLIVNTTFRDTLAPVELAAAQAALGEAEAAVATLAAVARRDPLTFPAWRALVSLLWTGDPVGWLDRLLDLGRPRLDALLAATSGLPARDRLRMLERLAGDHLSVAAAASHALELIPLLDGDGEAAVAWERWFATLEQVPRPTLVRLAHRLEGSAPASALRLWERLTDEPGANLGRARCHAAAGALLEAVDALGELQLDTMTAADVLFVATLSLGVGDRQTAAALLDALPGNPVGVTVEDVLRVAGAVGPDTLDRTQRRLARDRAA